MLATGGRFESSTRALRDWVRDLCPPDAADTTSGDDAGRRKAQARRVPGSVANRGVAGKRRLRKRREFRRAVALLRRQRHLIDYEEGRGCMERKFTVKAEIDVLKQLLGND